MKRNKGDKEQIVHHGGHRRAGQGEERAPMDGESGGNETKVVR